MIKLLLLTFIISSNSLFSQDYYTTLKKKEIKSIVNEDDLDKKIDSIKLNEIFDLERDVEPKCGLFVLGCSTDTLKIGFSDYKRKKEQLPIVQDFIDSEKLKKYKNVYLAFGFLDSYFESNNNEVLRFYPKRGYHIVRDSK